MIESCYAGFWAKAFEQAAASGSFSALCPGATLTVLTASDTEHVAYGDLTPNTGGSVYVNEFLTAYSQIAAGSGGLDVPLFQAHSRASANVARNPDESIRAMNPQIFQRTAPGGEVCGVALSPPSALVNPKHLKSQDFEVLVCGKRPADGSYTYEFACTNRHGSLVSVTNPNAGGAPTITSNHAVVGYLAKIDAPEGETDEITVKVYAPPLTGGGTRRLAGTARAQATIAVGKAGTRVTSGRFEVKTYPPSNFKDIFTVAAYVVTPRDPDAAFYEVFCDGFIDTQTGRRSFEFGYSEPPQAQFYANGDPGDGGAFTTPTEVWNDIARQYGDAAYGIGEMNKRFGSMRVKVTIMLK